MYQQESSARSLQQLLAGDFAFEATRITHDMTLHRIEVIGPFLGNKSAPIDGPGEHRTRSQTEFFPEEIGDRRLSLRTDNGFALHVGGILLEIRLLTMMER